MRVLAVETSTLTGAVAVTDGGRVVGETRLSVAVTHGERLLATIDALLQSARWSLDEVDGIAVAVGPGSFTGLRVGVSTAKGLAFATGKPLVGVPSLAALAWSLPHAAHVLCPVLDARKGEVYAGVYRTRDGWLEALGPDRAVAPSALAEDLARSTEGPVVFLGDAVEPWGELWTAVLGTRARLAPPGFRLPSAVSVADLAGPRLARGEAVDPATLVPLYLRPSEAELGARRPGDGRAGE